MPQKTFKTDELGEVTIVKRRGGRYLRLRIKPTGQIMVSIPHWTPYRAGLSFALERQEWVEKHRPRYTPQILKSGDLIGKQHILQINFGNYKAIRTRLAGNTVTVNAPVNVEAKLLQQKTAKAAERALKAEAEQHLLSRANELAGQHGYSFQSVTIKRLTSRWGSCSSDKRISLNYFLMQLPWELIDYVILHELVHTKHLNHGPKFWEAMASLIDNPKKLQKTVRQYKTMILPG